MSFLSDDVLRRLRSAPDLPDLSGTRYRLLEFIARGGMGAVYLAEDTALHRRVALKVLDPAASSPGLAARLLREARVLARLEHPGIVPVHDVGTLSDGRVFYAMKFVEGRRLDLHLAQLPSIPERLRLFTKICEAVAFAHARGILHRDLKPENIMVGPFGEVLVMDWGLAKSLSVAPDPSVTLLDEAASAPAPHSASLPRNLASSAAPRSTGASVPPSPLAPASRSSEISNLKSEIAFPPPASAVSSSSRISNLKSEIFSFPPVPQPADASALTAHGSVLGTPGYMPPEQARGHLHLLDQRSDVFALGALLHYVLTGRPPCSAGAGPPASPPSSAQQSSLTRPLAAICRKAMSPEPAARYSSASALAADVSRYLDAGPVSAYPEGLFGKLRRFATRHWLAFLIVLTFAVVRILMYLVFRR